MVRIYYVYSNRKIKNGNQVVQYQPDSHFLLYHQHILKIFLSIEIQKKSSKFETNSNLGDRLRTIQYSKSRMKFSNTDVSTRKLLGVESSNPSMIQLYLTST